jgi:Flp pilus assembly protein TadD
MLVLESALGIDSTSYGALWRASREAVTLGMLDADPDRARAQYDRAETFARRAIAVDSSGVAGQHYLAVALGRQALSEGIRARVSMAESVRAQTDRVLAMDSTYAPAYHVLGMWHAEVKRLSGFSKFIAQRVLGGSGFGDATWEAAEGHMRTAVALEPDVIMHRVELGRILLDLDRTDEARTELRTALELPVKEPIDPLHQQTAQDLLRDLSGS